MWVWRRRFSKLTSQQVSLASRPDFNGLQVWDAEHQPLQLMWGWSNKTPKSQASLSLPFKFEWPCVCAVHCFPLQNTNNFINSFFSVTLKNLIVENISFKQHFKCCFMFICVLIIWMKNICCKMTEELMLTIINQIWFMHPNKNLF